MDSTEDLSARVLLGHILGTEPPRTPITRSVTRATSSTSATRRSSRLTVKDASDQTPQSILRRSIRHKIRESITRKSLPAKRKTASFALKKTNTPGPASVLLNEDVTPRHILSNILRTEPIRSPVLHKEAEAQEPQPSSANSSITSKRPSIELSGLDFSDITFGNAASAAKGLSRKRQRHNLNVTAFEKRLKDGDDVEEENEESLCKRSLLSLSEPSSFSLKTPFVDVRTEKKGLQRRVGNRRKITEEEFGAAVNKRQLGEVSSFVKEGPVEATYSEDVSLSLSKLSEPDILSDLVHCKTALYAQADATASNLSIVATQDKPTVMASQLQRQTEQEELMVEEPNNLPEEKSMYLFPSEESGAPSLPRIIECFSLHESQNGGTDESQREEGKSSAYCKSEVEECFTNTQTSVSLIDDKAKSEEEETVLEAQTEEDMKDFENEEVGTIDSASNTSNVHSGLEMGANESSQPHTGIPDFAESSLHEVVSASLTEADTNKENTFTKDSGHLSNASPKEAAAQDPAEQEQEWEDEEIEEADTNQENTFTKDSGHLSNASPKEAAAQDPDDQEQEWEDEEEDEEIEEVPSKTPAFVRQKRLFSYPDPLASPSVLKNVQTSDTSEGVPAPKPKQVRKRSPRPAKKEGGLPKSYLMSVFKHFAKTKVSADVYPVLKEIMDKFFQRLAEDLETYASHAKRKTIQVEDAELLLKRQGYVNDKVPVQVLIEKYLRMDQRKLLIPIATSGNVVIPKER